MADHDIDLDELLADAAAELRAVEMFSLARAVDIARDRLGGHDATTLGLANFDASEEKDS